MLPNLEMPDYSAMLHGSDIVPNVGLSDRLASKPRLRSFAVVTGAILTWISLNLWFSLINGGQNFNSTTADPWSPLGWLFAVLALSASTLVAGFRVTTIIASYIVLGFIAVVSAQILFQPADLWEPRSVVPDIINTFGGAIALIVVAFAFARCLPVSAREFLRLDLPEHRLILAFALPITVWTTIILLWPFTPFNPVKHPLAPDTFITIYDALGNEATLTLAYVAVLVPIGEELLFRGLITSVINKATNLAIASLISAALFAILHMNPQFFSLNHFLHVFVLSIILAATFLISKSIWPGVVLHSANNAIVAIQSIYS